MGPGVHQGKEYRREIRKTSLRQSKRREIGSAVSTAEVRVRHPPAPPSARLVNVPETEPLLYSVCGGPERRARGTSHVAAAGPPKRKAVFQHRRQAPEMAEDVTARRDGHLMGLIQRPWRWMIAGSYPASPTNPGLDTPG